MKSSIMFPDKNGVWCDVVDEVKREGVFWTYNNPSGLKLGEDFLIHSQIHESNSPTKAKEYLITLKQHHENSNSSIAIPPPDSCNDHSDNVADGSI